MSDLTAQYNMTSIEAVRHGIARKTSTRPYFANAETVRQVVTDYDHHPYGRWFRGVYYYPDPILAEREAGWRPLQNGCYSVVRPVEPETDPRNCFESACSTIYPCFPDLEGRFSNQERLDQAVNGNCLQAYR